jgi:hypothetical protein
MKRVLTFVLIIAAACCMAEKAAVRIDIDGRADQIELKPDVCQNVAMDNPGWMGDKKQFYLSAMSKATVGSYWKEFFISFIPQKDGKVRLSLMGPWYKPENAEKNLPIWVAYDNLEIMGAEAQNTDFELESVNGVFDGWNGDKANMVKGASDAQSGKNYIKVWHNSPFTQEITVQKGKLVSIKFSVKAIGDDGVIVQSNL